MHLLLLGYKFTFCSYMCILILKIARRLVVKVRDVIKLVEADGWCHVRTRGDHRQYKHPIKKGRVTIPGHPSGLICNHDATHTCVV